MGRPRKYKSDEERHEARKRTRREYYARNAVQERSRALSRYHARSERARSARTVTSKATDEGPHLQDLLPHTVKSFGLPLVVNESSDLELFAVCLTADLRNWHDGQSKTESDAWEELTERILAADGRRRRLNALQKEIQQKRLVALQVEAYAEDGQAAASACLDRRSESRLARIVEKAASTDRALEQLHHFCELEVASLQIMYDNDALVWHGTIQRVL